MHELLDKTIGNYQIEAVIGAGGMSQVFRGRHIHLDRIAAVKVMHDSIAADPGFRARFRQEARAIATLDHPHIIQIYDFGEQDGRFYLVMELLPEGTLRTITGKMPQPWPLDTAADLARQAADALAFAHDKGIIHRDVKPDNMLLSRATTSKGLKQYHLKLSDFGLARLIENSGLTMSGTTMGTPAYTSPEQIQGSPLDGRSDIYALGIVLYELTTGQLPFDVRSVSEAVYKHMYVQPTAPRQLRPEIPESLEAIILRCLAKDPGDRFASAAELSTALRAVFDSTSAPPPFSPADVPAAPTTAYPTSPLNAPTTFQTALHPPYPTTAPAPTVSPAQPGAPRRRPLPLVGLTIAAALLGAALVVLLLAQSGGAQAPVATLAGLGLVALLVAVFFLARARQASGGAPEAPPARRPVAAPGVSDADLAVRRPTVFFKEKSAQPPPAGLMADSAASLVSSQTIVFKPNLVSQADDQIAEELVLHKDYEQLWRAIAYAEGGRYLLTGYGPFGGTSLLNCAVEKARRELEKTGSSEGALLVFHFRLTREHADEFEVEANNFSLGHLRPLASPRPHAGIEALKAYAEQETAASGATVHRMDFTLASPLSTSFLERSRRVPGRPRKASEYDLSQFIADLHAFLEEHQDNSALRQIVGRLLGSESLPSRVVIIFDKIRYLETLQALAKSELFGNRRILALVVARKEDYDRWANVDEALEEVRFTKWYVPCLWDSDLDRVLFEAVPPQGEDFDQNWTRFRRHLEYVGRGSLGNVIQELKEPKNTSHGPGISFVDINYLAQRDEVLHNAWIQEMLDHNWPHILSDLFVGKFQTEAKDRARIGVYQLIDWIAARRGRFALDQLLDATASRHITISDDAGVRAQTVQNLLLVLVKTGYLEQNGDQYRINLDHANPPRPQKLRLKRRRSGGASDQPAARPEPAPGGTVVLPAATSGTPDRPQQPAEAAEPSQTPAPAPVGGTILISPNNTVLIPPNDGPADDEREHLKKLRKAHQQRLRVLEIQEARAGMHVDAQVQIEIDELKHKIADLDRRLGHLEPPQAGD